MSYFAFLALFLGPPILVFGLLEASARRQGPRSNPLPLWSIGLMAAIALIYTTPWDNYLVATRVWWYDPDLVTGILIGWVPIEEYTFFVVQPLAVGLWLAFWIGRLPDNGAVPVNEGRARMVRWAAFVAVLAVWVIGTILLFVGWEPGTYLGLALAWALPPMLLQIGFGGDILVRYRRLVALGIVVPTLYLAAADSLAISAGTWTIDPAQSTGILLGSLPVEEFVFFLLTNTLVTLGLVLIWAPESRVRLKKGKFSPSEAEQIQNR